MNTHATIRVFNAAPLAGWLIHDGQRLPVAADSQPGVAFRNGWRVAPGTYSACHWQDLGGDLWNHIGSPLDIVAFLPAYGSRPMTTGCRSAICAMISERYPGEIDNRITEHLADDLIAFLNTRSLYVEGRFRTQLPHLSRLR